MSAIPGRVTPAHTNQRAAGKTRAPTANKYPDMVSSYFNRKPGTATVTNADYVYDIATASGSKAGTAAVTSGGWLADLLSLF
jgi:hypothetical protein